MCTVLHLVLQQRTSETCNDLVQWNCFYRHKHNCISVELLLPSYGHTETDIQRGVARRERVVRPPRGGKVGGKMVICNVKLFYFIPRKFLNNQENK